jgi:hypothetical protein
MSFTRERWWYSLFDQKENRRFDSISEQRWRRGKMFCPGKRWGDSALWAEGKAFRRGAHQPALRATRTGRLAVDLVRFESSPPYLKEIIL